MLCSCQSAEDISARITENGFAFAFRESDVDKAKRRMEDIISKLNLYMEDEEKSARFFFRAAAYNLDNEDKNCEVILYNLRRNCNKLYQNDKQLIVCDRAMMNEAIEERKLLERIEKGFDEQEFKFYLQFVVNNKTEGIVSAEALSRWERKDIGVVLPAIYISQMESSGLISRLDYHMFEMVCKQLHKWRDTEFSEYTISCNFTRITISEIDFVSKIKEISSKYVFDKTKLIMEITEDAIEKNLDVALENILKCKEIGFKIALDDVGRGCTSLVNLFEYPIDIVKIDRDLLLKAEGNGKNLFLGIISFVRSLGLKVVCEGVETNEQNALVVETDCDYIQGWYYSLVYPEHEAENFAREYCRKLDNGKRE